MLWISPKVSLAILPNLESWSGPRDDDIHNARIVHNRFNSIGIPLFIERNSTSICIERELLIIESVVIQRIGRPKTWGLAIRVKYLSIELACSTDPTIKKVIAKSLVNLVRRL